MSSSDQLQRCSLDDLRLEDEKFTDRSEIKPWLHKTLLDKKGIEVVIYRSDSLKVVFKCRNGSREVVGSKSGDPRVPPRRQTTCPFKIRANYSFKNKFWSLVIMNDCHNHDVYHPAEISTSLSTSDVNLSNKQNHKSTHKSKHTHSHTHTHTHTHTHNSNNTNLIHINNINDGSTSSHGSTMDGAFTNETAILPSSHDSTKSGSTTDVFGNLIESAASSVSSVVLSSNHSPVEPSTSAFQNRPQSSPKHQTLRSFHSNKIDESKLNPDQVVQYLRNEVNQLISRSIYKNNLIKEEDKSSILDSFTQQLLLDHKDVLLLSNKELFNATGNMTILPKPTKVDKVARKRSVQSPRQKQQQKKSLLSSWLNTSNTNNPNLIPLSPLLNDSDNEYSTANTTNGATSMDNLHLPVINIGNNVTSSHPVNFVFPSQVSSQIQNQNQQLPSFNSIQNKLPLSPSANSSFLNNNSNGAITTTTTSTNTNTTSSLMPPIGSTPTTLTPAHILESSNKNLFNLSSTSASAALSDFKIGGPMNIMGNNIFSGQSLLNGGPNIIPANVLKDTSNFLTNSNFNTLPSTNIQSRDANSNSNPNSGANGLLNNFNDSGW